MSGAQTSTFPDQNKLLEANAQQIANYYAPERNRLFVQQAQQTIGSNEMEAMSRAASGLMNLPEGQREAAYPGVIQYLQANGYAKNAPPVYPGHAVTQQLASLGVPAEKQYEQGIVRTAADNFRTSLTGGPATPAAPAGEGTYTGSVIASEGTGKNPRSSATGTGQFIDSTWNEFAAAHPQLFAGKTPEQILAARSDPALGAVAVDWLAQRNAPVLQAAGVTPSGQSLRLAHYLGPAPAAAVMQAPDATPVRDVLLQSIGPERTAKYLEANPELATATAGSLRGRYANVPAPAFLGGPRPVQVAGPGAPTGSPPVAPAAPIPPPAVPVAPVAPPAAGGTVAEDPANQALLNSLPSIGGAQPPAAPTAPVAPAAPATAAPSVLPPLPPAPPPTDRTTGLTADQTRTLVAQSTNARTRQDIAELDAKAQTYRQQNIVAQKEYEQAVYTRQEKAEADRRAAAQEARAEAEAKRKADEDARKAALKVRGDATDAQHENTLITGDPKSPEYKSAYASYATPKLANGILVKPNMQPYRLPQEEDGTPITTYGDAPMVLGPGDLGKLRDAETQAAALKSSLTDFVSVFQKATGPERAWAASGGSGELQSAWTNAAMLAKGEALYNLGVLSGPDMSVIRGALADPSTIRGWFTSPETVRKQVERITRILDTRLDQMRRSYGTGLSATTAPPAAPGSPASRPPLSSFGSP